MKLVVLEKLNLSTESRCFPFFRKTKSLLPGLQHVSQFSPILSMVDSGLNFGVSRRAARQTVPDFSKDSSKSREPITN